jgi:hypothetical protein
LFTEHGFTEYGSFIIGPFTVRWSGGTLRLANRAAIPMAMGARWVRNISAADGSAALALSVMENQGVAVTKEVIRSPVFKADPAVSGDETEVKVTENRIRKADSEAMRDTDTQPAAARTHYAPEVDDTGDANSTHSHVASVLSTPC